MTVAEIAQLLGGVVEGDGAAAIRGLAGLREAEPGDLSFLSSPKYAAHLAATRASAALVRKDWSGAAPCALIRVDHPDRAFQRVVMALAPPPVARVPGVHPSAVVAPDAVLGAGVCVEAHAVIEPGARVGDRTVIGAGCYLGHAAAVGCDGLLYPHVVIRERCRVGDRAIIHPGAVIGSDGFGFAPVGDTWQKIPQVGIVDVGDDVEIGANVTIDRARFGKTVIGHGVKLDNLIQIAHNVRVGDHTVMAAQVGVSGSTLIGRHVQIGGQAGLIGHLAVADGTMIAGSTNVIEDTQPRSILMGYVATPHLEFKRIQAVTQRLPELKRKVTDLEARLAALEQGAGAKEGRTP